MTASACSACPRSPLKSGGMSLDMNLDEIAIVSRARARRCAIDAAQPHVLFTPAAARATDDAPGPEHTACCTCCSLARGQYRASSSSQLLRHRHMYAQSCCAAALSCTTLQRAVVNFCIAQ